MRESVLLEKYGTWWDQNVRDKAKEWWEEANKPPELPFCQGVDPEDGRQVDCGLIQGLDQTKDLVTQNRFTTTTSLPELIQSWTNFALGFLFVLAMTALIYAGFLWVTDFGSGTNQKTAIAIIKYVAIGLLIILVAYPIVWTIINATQ